MRYYIAQTPAVKGAVTEIEGPPHSLDAKPEGEVGETVLGNGVVEEEVAES